LFSWLRALWRLPILLRLGSGLLADPWVPLSLRAGVLSFLVLILSPLDLPSNIPILGQFWDVALAVTVLEHFIEQWAPAAVVNEHHQRLGLFRPLIRVVLHESALLGE
jgi:uncharacterized membrane protein YkvA (DUF1232 family)